MNLTWDNVLYTLFLFIMVVSVYIWINIIKNTPNPEGSIYDGKAELNYKPSNVKMPPGSSYL